MKDGTTFLTETKKISPWLKEKTEQLKELLKNSNLNIDVDPTTAPSTYWKLNSWTSNNSKS